MNCEEFKFNLDERKPEPAWLAYLIGAGMACCFALIFYWGI
jgi:hypothetical protein